MARAHRAVVTAIDPPGYPSPSIVDSRRLPGPNLYSVRPGAVLEVALRDTDADALLGAWRARVTELGRRLGWDALAPVVRRHAEGAALFIAAPLDGLMTATDVNEQAWVLAESGGYAPPAAAVVAQLAAAAQAERASRPMLAAVVGEAHARGVNAAFDDDTLTLGSGAGARSWPLGDVPAARDIHWPALHDVPIALVTGSNGKTTTTRLVAAMWRAAGVTPGWSCSDGAWAGDDRLEFGDFSGPAGARRVLRSPGIGAAVLETARGGMLRRGLAVSRASAAIITNISADHFGEYGIGTVRDLADVKGVVASVLDASGHLVLNADDPLLVELAARLAVRVAWFSARAEHPTLDEHVRRGGAAALVRDGHALLHRDGTWHDLGGVTGMPLTLQGAAPHNVANLLGAALLGSVMGIPVEAIRRALAEFGALAQDNPGRLQVYRFGTVTVLVDYAHNPDGLAALCATAKAMPAGRRLLLLGQAGNRDDVQLRALAQAAWSVVPFDRILVKEEIALLRGRSEGEVPRVLVAELARLGVPADRVEVEPSELAAVRSAFTWVREGDMLVCPIHVDKDAVLAWLGRLAAAGWRAGLPLPD